MGSTGNDIGCSNTVGPSPCSTKLTNDTFRDGRNKITELIIDGINLDIIINFGNTDDQIKRRTEIRSNGRLTVDGRTFNFGDRYNHYTSGRTRWRHNNRISWTIGQKVALSLTIPTLTATNVTPTTATLTLAHGPVAAWYYKGAQSGAACVPVPAGTTTARLRGLSENTTYTYKAYSNSGCTTALTPDVTFTTLPPPTVSLEVIYETNHRHLEEGKPDVEVSIVPTFSWGWEATDIPLVVTGGTAEAGDYRTNPENRVVPIRRPARSPRYGVMKLYPNRDADTQDETVTVSLGTLPNGLVAGSPSSVTITIKDDGVDRSGGGGGAGPQTTWSSTLTVDNGVRNHTGLKGCNDIGGGDIAACSSALSSNTFSHGGASHRVETVLLTERLGEADLLEVVLDRPLPASVIAGGTLTVDGRSFPLSSGTAETLTSRISPSGRWSVRWPARLNWYDGRRVSLSLTLPGGGSGGGTSGSGGGTGGGTGSGDTEQQQQGQQGQQQGQQGQVQQEQEPQVTITNTRTRPSVGNRLRPPRPGTTSLVFPVTLSPAASEPVQVDYTTRNGTARAGEDYVSASGTLTFVPGETAQTVAVAVLPGERPGDGETMTLELSNPQGGGAVIADGQGVGTILTVAAERPTGAVEQQTTRLGRTVAEQVLDAVDARMGSAPSPGLAMTLAGQPLQWPDGDDGSQPVAEQVAQQVAEHLTQWVSISGGNVAVRRLDGNELLASSSFALNTPSSSGGLLSFWGGGAVTSFDGRDGDLSLDGEVTTWLLGADWHWGHWPDGGETRRSTAGLVVSRSSSSGGYDSGSGGMKGDVDSTLTGAFPWMRHRLTERLEVWGAAGYGQGDLKVTLKRPGTDRKGAAMETDLNLWLAAGGLRGTLLEGGNDGLTLTGKSDVMAVGTSSGRADGLEAADARLTRLRLALEAERPIPLGRAESEADADARGTLTPSLEVAMRYDGGEPRRKAV